MLEPCAVKVASTVLRGVGGSNTTILPDKTIKEQYDDIVKERPHMERIEEEIRIFERPSAQNSVAMKEYIYKLEKIINYAIEKE